MRGIALGVVAALCWAGGAEAQSFLCPYEVSSGLGGRLMGSGIGTRAQSVGWHPRGSGSSIDLDIAYRGSSLERLDAPSGGNIQVRFQKRPQTVVFTVEDGTGWKWNPAGKIGDWSAGGSADFRAYIAFTPTTNDGRHLLEGASSGRTLRVTVWADDAMYADERFDLSRTSARDELLARLRASVKRPPACAPTSSVAPLRPVSR